MHLYHLSVLPPGGAKLLAHGSFSGVRQQEIVLASDSSLELLQLTKAGQLVSLGRGDAFATIRAIAPFRLTGSRQDYLLVTSDSGTLSLLSFSLASRRFIRLRCETFGKSGCRRVIPGQYLAADPKGRACMVAAVERSKFAYILTRDSTEHVAIQSPLDAHTTGAVSHGLVALDVAFENPMFAALEVLHDDPHGTKHLVYYEIDLGLNHVVRRYSSPVRDHSFVLLPVPGGTDGPGGVLVCSLGWLSYRNLSKEAEREDDPAQMSDAAETNPCHHALHVPIPYRVADEKQGPGYGESSMIVCGILHRHKNVFFFLLCNEQGDLLKVELDWSEDDGVSEIRVLYFDTLPAPAYALSIFRSGYLFAAMETGDPLFLKFTATTLAGDDSAGGVSIVRRTPTGGSDGAGSTGCPQEMQPKLPFAPRTDFKYFTFVDLIESLGPSISLLSGDFCGEGSSQLVATSGRGKQSCIRVLRRGLSVADLMSQEMPGTITSCFTLREKASDKVDRYIVLSFADSSKVLRISEDTVGEAQNSGFVTDGATIAAVQSGESSFVQVHSGGIRCIPGGEASRKVDWNPPAGVIVTNACANSSQVFLALSDGSAVYVRVQGDSGIVSEIAKLADVVTRSSANDALSSTSFLSMRPSVAIQELPAGRQAASYMALSDTQSNVVRLYRLDGQKELQSVGVHMSPAPVSSLALVDFADVSGNQMGQSPMLSLIVGTRKGAVVKLKVDMASGSLSEKKSFYLGGGSVSVHRLCMGGVPTCAVLSQKPWLLHRQGSRVRLSPLCTEKLDYIAPLATVQHTDGFVGSYGSTLRFMDMDALSALTQSALLPDALPPSMVPSGAALGSTFFTSKTMLKCLPRRIAALDSGGRNSSTLEGAIDAVGSSDGLFVVLESEQNSRLVRASPNLGTGTSSAQTESTAKYVVAEGFAGFWASQIRLISIKPSLIEDEAAESDIAGLESEYEQILGSFYAPACKTLQEIPLLDGASCALSVAVSSTMSGSSEGHTHVVVGTALNLKLRVTGENTPFHAAANHGSGHLKESGELRVYRLNREAMQLELLHVTPVEEPVQVMSAFRDKILVGIGTSLRLYGLGKRQMLRKSETRRCVQNKICAIAVAGGDRVFVGDVQSSVTLLKYQTNSGPARFSLVGNGASANCGLDGSPGSFVPIASDVMPRHIGSLLALDYSTVCGSDKFGNIFVLRLPSELVAVGDDPVSDAQGSLDHSRMRFVAEACYHVGSVVTGLVCGSLGIGSESRPGSNIAQYSGKETAILYSTISGSVGMLAPFTNKSDLELMTSIEKAMQSRDISLVKRSHIAYRSSFFPSRRVIDGDLCETYIGLPFDDQKAVAISMERERSDVLRRLDEIRTSLI